MIILMMKFTDFSKNIMEYNLMKKLFLLSIIVLCMCSCRFMYNRAGDSSELKPTYVEKYEKPTS